MIRSESLIVKPDDARPNGRSGECFYCHQPMAAEHEPGCVIRERTVVMDYTIRVVRVVPEDWTPEQIEFRYNESTWCAGNLLDELDALDPDQDHVCICDRTEAVFVREATTEDEDRYKVCGLETEAVVDGKDEAENA